MNIRVASQTVANLCNALKALQEINVNFYHNYLNFKAQFGDDFYDMGDDEDVKPVFDDLSGDEFDEGQSV